jgi:hypothetical protein
VSKPWQSLEEIPGLVALISPWQKHVGDRFRAFRALCLDVSPRTAHLFPCLLARECAHRIIPMPEALNQLPSTLSLKPSTIAIGFCERDPRHCDHLELSGEDITPLQLNWQKLGRAICKAFGLETKFADIHVPNTFQIGTWSADSVPVVLTIQWQRRAFRHAVAELGLRLHRPYILLAPTNLHLDATCQELLGHAGAEFFPLATTVRLTDHGTLHSIRTPGELFAKFTPQPKDADLSVAERARAIVSQFDATTYRVFELYCIHELSAAQVAGKMKMSKTAVMRRLAQIRKRTGLKPKNLRKFSDHLSRAKVESGKEAEDDEDKP